MSARVLLMSSVLGLLLCAPLLGQQQNIQQPTTVQLPSFSFFTVSTTVLVPDSARGYGRVYAGGLSSAASGRNEFGPPFLPGQRAIGAEHRAAGMSIAAQIHDLHAMDEDHLLLRPELRAARTRPLAPPARRGEAVAPEPVRDDPIRSVAAIRQERERKAAERQAEALALLERGRKSAADGKPGVARIYYQMAASKADEALKAEIADLLEALPDERPSSSKRD